MSQRTTAETVAWYRANEVWPAQIGFDPDGMCLKICRTARNIGPAFPSALSAQKATPKAHRVYNVEDIRKGMVVYYDDPNDENPYGHVATVVGRRRGVPRGDLASLLTRTNSVKSNQIVVVAGDYYPKYWGDKFQFAATWLNGVTLDLPDVKVKTPAFPASGLKRLARLVDVLDEMIDNHKGNTRVVKALRRDKRELLQTLDELKSG